MKFWLVEVEVSSQLSVMDEMARGKIPVGPIRGNICRRRIETRQYVIMAEHRDQAILKLRRECGFPLESAQEISRNRAADLFHEMQNARCDRAMSKFLPEVEHALKIR